MSKLRRQVRRSVTTGAQVFASVEHTSLGMATVRLSENGARLTNLRVVGQPVKVGQRIIVDSSAEGTPVVRPLTIAEPTVEEKLDIAPFVDFPEPGLEDEVPTIPGEGSDFEVVAGKVTRASNFVQTYVSTSYGRIDRTLTKTLYDTHNLFDAATGQLFTQNQPGTYLMRYTCAIQPEPGVALFEAIVYNTYVSRKFRRVLGHTLPVVVTHSTIFRYPADYTSEPILQYRIYDTLATGYVSSITLPALANKYPIFEWWRIAPYTSTAVEAYPWWYWE